MEVTLSTQYVAAGVTFFLLLISTGIFAKLISLCVKAEIKNEYYGGKMAILVIIGIVFVIPFAINWLRFVFTIANDLL